MSENQATPPKKNVEECPTSTGEGGPSSAVATAASIGRKERRKATKREKRKQKRKELAEKEREEEEALLNDPEEQLRIQLEEERERERLERERKEFEERERLYLEEVARKKAQEEEEEERRRVIQEEDRSKQNQVGCENEANDDDGWEYVEDGPPEIIWQGNEIIVKKNKVKVRKKDTVTHFIKEDLDRPTSNPLPPQSEAFSEYKNVSMLSAQELLDNVAQQTPNFGTEQDKAHCPFHLKTGACRFGTRCSRVHFYPDKSCTLLMKNMYNGPGIAWEQDEGLEYTDEEVERYYEEFYEDVHTEFLKFGEIVNFKVCRNGSFHLRGNVYVHYKSLDSAVLAYHSVNGRYFAGKQVQCEFIGVTRWKVAICGEYMKSKLKTCSRGTACNFIHCFRNPGGDYEWADSDKPPPRYWSRKMVALFGHSDDSGHDRHIEQESPVQSWKQTKMLTADTNSRRSRRSQSRDNEYSKKSSRRYYEDHNVESSDQRGHSGSHRRQQEELDQNLYNEEVHSRNYHQREKTSHGNDSNRKWLERGRDGEKYRLSYGKQSRHHQNGRSEYDSYKQDAERHSDSDHDASVLTRYRVENRRHKQKGKNPEHREPASHGLGDYEYSMNRTHCSDSSGDSSYENNDKDIHHYDDSVEHHERSKSRGERGRWEESHYSGRELDEGIDAEGHWKPEKTANQKHHGSRKASDGELPSLNTKDAKTGDRDESYHESRLKRSSRSGKRKDSSEDTIHDERSKESEEIGRVDKVKHRSRHHKRHKSSS